MRTGYRAADGTTLFSFLMEPNHAMLTLHTKLEAGLTPDLIPDGELVLRYDQREKSRLRTRLTSGEEAALFMLRGTVLRHGDLLQGDDGRVVQIVAANEPVYRIQCANENQLLRCAFHLGNRHTQAQIGSEAGQSFLRIRQDPVLKTMLHGLGATVSEEIAAFEPEAGAYGGGHHHTDETTDPHHPGYHPLAPIPLRQKIHRPSDPKES